MPNTNSSFSPFSRVDQLKQQLQKLEDLNHASVDPSFLEQFDQETEDILQRVDGRGSKLAAYELATTAEAESLVNLPESAQEAPSQDLLQKSLQQRRQMVLGFIRELEDLEQQEAEVLTGEDKEDPPSLT